MKTYYEILGVVRTANGDDISDAFRKLGKELHPDTFPSPDAASFAMVSEAYATLKHPGKRRNYDLALTALYGVCSSCKGEGKTGRTIGFRSRIEKKCEICNGVGVDPRRIRN